MHGRIAVLAAAALIAGGISVPLAAHADTMSLNQLEAQLTIASPNLVGYDRTLFGDWTFTTGDGCDTRANLLKQQTQVTVTFSSGCTVASGQWLSWYDNQTWTLGSQVQIDHLVPLGEAWASGAENWTPAQRSAFANDTIGYQLQIVTSSVNEAKGDGDPTVWMPPAASAECQYITDWVLTKYRWSLNVDTREQSAIAGYLAHNGCGDQTVTVPSVVVQPSSSGGTTPAGDPVTPPAGGQTVYRFWNSHSGAHFYTISLDERNQILRTYYVDQWKYEGPAWTAYATEVAGTVPLYRFFSTQYQGHFFTTSAPERDSIIASYSSNEWNYEGVAYYVFPANTTTSGISAVARFWSSDYKQHFYTSDPAEASFTKTYYPRNVWLFERDDFAIPTASATVAPMIDAKNCSDFQNHQQAQDWYNAYVTQYGDVSGLDGNNNGVACDDPGPVAPAPPTPPAPPISVTGVTPGAFCAAALNGAYGLTNTGVLMRCETSATDSRLRWRAA